MSSVPDRKKIVIVGAGFGGLALAKALGNNFHFDVTLIDRRNYHLFQSLLYQWLWHYLTYSRSARIIMSRHWRSFHSPVE